MSRVLNNLQSSTRCLELYTAGYKGAATNSTNSHFLTSKSVTTTALREPGTLKSGGNFQTFPFDFKVKYWQSSLRAVHRWALQGPEAREQDDAHSQSLGSEGYQRPVSLKEIRKRKESQKAGGGIQKQTGKAKPGAAHIKGEETESSCRAGAKEQGRESVVSFEDESMPVHVSWRPALEGRSGRTVVATDNLKTGPLHEVPKVASFVTRSPSETVSGDIPLKGLPSVDGRSGTSKSRKVQIPSAAQQKGPRFLTVEEFLAREAEKKKMDGVQDSENEALTALESFKLSSSAPHKEGRSLRGQRASHRKHRRLSNLDMHSDGEEADTDKPIDPQEVEGAKEKAIFLLNRRNMSAFELGEKLTQSGFSPRVVSAVVDRMQEIGLQNDLEYAEAFARVRWQSFRWGPDRVRRELKSRGIVVEDLDEAISRIYGDRANMLRVHAPFESDLDETGQDCEDDISTNVERDLYIAAKRHFLSSGGLDGHRRWKRTADWLARRGFGWGTASSIMVALKAESNIWK